MFGHRKSGFQLRKPRVACACGRAIGNTNFAVISFDGIDALHRHVECLHCIRERRRNRRHPAFRERPGA